MESVVNRLFQFERVYNLSCEKQLPLSQTTNFRFFQTERICRRQFQYYLFIINPFPNKPCFLRVRSKSLLKTLWEKEKLFVSSNFSFSHSVFYRFGEFSVNIIKLESVVQTERICRRQFQYVFFTINPFPNKPCFLRVRSKSLLKTLWEKEKLLVSSNFSFSHSVFYRFGELSVNIIKLKSVVNRLFQFERVYNLSFEKQLPLSQTTNFRFFQTERICRRQFQHVFIFTIKYKSMPILST